MFDRILFVCLLIGCASGNEVPFSDDLVEEVCLAAMSTVVAQMSPRERIKFHEGFSDPETKALDVEQRTKMLEHIREHTNELLHLVEESCSQTAQGVDSSKENPPIRLIDENSPEQNELSKETGEGAISKSALKYWWEEELMAAFLILGFVGLVVLLFAKLGWLSQSRVRKFAQAGYELRAKHVPKERSY